MNKIHKQIDLKEKLFGIDLINADTCLTVKDLADAEGISVKIKRNDSSEKDIHHYHCNMAENLLELHIPKLGKFKVESGNKITIRHNFYTEPEETLVFLYGSCMGGVLYQRGIIPLHGSTVLTENGAVLFLGVSGAGKSTIAAALAERGYPIICDDISAIKSEDRNAVLIPSKADLKLWKRSLDMLNKKANGFIPVRNQLKKYYLPLNTEDLKDHYPVHKIYILYTHNEASIEFSEPLKGKQKFNRVEHHAYRRKFIKGLNRKNQFFTTIMSLLLKVEVKTLARPKEGHFKELIDRIEHDMLLD